MRKQTHQNQRFEFNKYDSHHGKVDKAGFLLMPGEVEEFKRLIDLELGFDYAFQRLSGKAIFDDAGNRVYFDIKLVVEITNTNEQKYEVKK